MLANVFTKTTRDSWKGIVIGAITMGAMFLFAMAAYRDIDIAGLYSNMPEAFLSLMGIPAGADVGALAYGAIYLSYGALTMGALVLVMGAGTITGEERNGTLGLLLGNPKSRTNVLLSKAGSMVLLTIVGTLILWAAGAITPAVLDVDVSGIAVEALILHMFINALFWGFLAMAIGAWTGNRGLASGVTAGIMFLSFIAVGLLPLVESLENLTRVFPWYYFSGSDPHLNGTNWGHLGVLSAGIVVLGLASVVGFNRRDLKGQATGVSIMDRLRANPMTEKVADRLAGSARVSHIWSKTASEYQGLLFVVAALMFFIMGVLIGPIYNTIDSALVDLADSFPEEMLAVFGGGDMSTPEGFYQIETFGMMAPIAVSVVTVMIGARALAGEEANRTMGLLLANPVSRTTVLLQKTFTMVLYAFAVGLATFAGVAAGSLLGGLGINMVNIAATCLLVTLLGLVFGGLALALGAATGRVSVATYGAVGVALVMFLANGFLPLNDSAAGYAKVSPFYYYLSSDPLNNGMHWGHGAALTALTVALIALAVWLFSRRDLRQTG
jgi:ABC-2 type transport system permease protein